MFDTNNILLMRNWTQSLVKKTAAVREWLNLEKTPWSNGKRIIELSYRKISWSVSLSQIDLLATDKSRYFAQPRPIIVNRFVSGSQSQIALMCDDISLAKITTKPRFDNAKCKFYYEPIPKAVKMKRIPTRKQPEGSESLSKCRTNQAWWWILSMCRNSA